ncbi:hypothetical protein Tco_0863090 [Tanacetum coccineum]
MGRSFEYRLNPLYAIKECSSCGALYTTDYCCSKGGLVDKIICDLNKTPDSSQRPLRVKCGNPVEGPYCRGCALLRKKFKEDLFTYCVENGIFQDHQDTFESSNDNTNVVNAPQEPFVMESFVNDALLVEQLTSLCDMVGQYIQKKEEEKQIEEEQAAKARYWKIPVCYDDDDDEESSIPLKDIIISGLPPCVSIIPDSPKTDSLIMVDKHLDTIPETESDKFIKSSVENLVQNLSESKDASDGVCDLSICDDFPKSHLVSFSNPLFDINDDCTSSDDELFSEEDVPMENFKFFSNPLFDLDEEIFASEITILHSIPPRIDDVNLDPEGDILFLDSLIYDNSSPCPPEEFTSENPTESLSLSPILDEDSYSLMEEIDIFLNGNGSIPPGIESDDYDSEDEDNSTSRLEFESFHVDYLDSGDSTIDVVEDIPVDVPNI